MSTKIQSISPSGVSYNYFVTMNWDRNDVSIMKVDSEAWFIQVCHTEHELIKN